MFGLNPPGSNPESSSEYSRELLGGDVVRRWEEVLGRSLSGEEVGEVSMPEECGGGVGVAVEGDKSGGGCWERSVSRNMKEGSQIQLHGEVCWKSNNYFRNCPGSFVEQIVSFDDNKAFLVHSRR